MRSPPTPVPYSFQQRQRAKRSALNGILGASFSQVSQSRVAVDRSVGGGYSQAPVGSFRPRVISTCSISPIAPPLYISRAFSQSIELTLWEPISTILLFFCNHIKTIGDCMRHRFLTVYIFPGIAGIDNYSFMPVIRHSSNDTIYI